MTLALFFQGVNVTHVQAASVGWFYGGRNEGKERHLVQLLAISQKPYGKM